MSLGEHTADAYSAAVCPDSPSDPVTVDPATVDPATVDPAGIDTTRRRPSVGRLVGATALAILSPLVVFRAYGVETFFQLSGADPFIYTGYTFSFADLIERWGYPYYAVRFGLIIPSNLFAEFFGAEAGYLIMRWVLASAAAAAIYAALSRIHRALLGVLAVSLLLLSPTFIRAVMTNYSTTVGVPAVAVAFALTVTPFDGWRLHLARLGAGMAAGLAINSNVFSVLPLATLAAVWIWVRRQDASAVVKEFAWLAAGAALVTAIGYSVYALRFGDGNLVAPSLTAVDRLSSAPGPDNEPGLDWLDFRPEIWLPVVVSLICVLAIWSSGRRATPATKAIAAAPLAMWVGYACHTFVLGSNTLEIYFYTSYMIGPTSMALAVAIGLLAERWTKYRSGQAVFACIVLVTAAPVLWTHVLRDMRFWSLNGLLPVTILICLVATGARSRGWLAAPVVAMLSVLPALTTLASPQGVPNPPGARPRQEPSYPTAMFRYDDITLDLYLLAADFASSVPRTAVDAGSVVFWRPQNDYTATLMQWTYLGPYSALPDAADPFPALDPATERQLIDRTPRFLVVLSTQAGVPELGEAALSQLGITPLRRTSFTLTRGPFQLFVVELELSPDRCDGDQLGETTPWSSLPLCDAAP
jgi:hypothetical protein